MFSNLMIAHLDDETAAKIQALEAEIGKHMMAFTPGVSIAKLTEEEVQKIAALEKEAGITLLVYNKVD